MYGYFLTPDAYYDAIIGWQRDRNGVEGLTKDAIGYENGVPARGRSRLWTVPRAEQSPAPTLYY